MENAYAAAETTTIRILAMLLQPDAGTARVLGRCRRPGPRGPRPGEPDRPVRLGRRGPDRRGEPRHDRRLLGHPRWRAKTRAGELREAFGLSEAAGLSRRTRAVCADGWPSRRRCPARQPADRDHPDGPARVHRHPGRRHHRRPARDRPGPRAPRPQDARPQPGRPAPARQATRSAAMSHDPGQLAAAYLTTMRPRARRRFEAHLLACEPCWQEICLARRSRQLAETTRDLAPPGLRDDIRAAVTTAATLAASPPASQGPVMATALMAAARSPCSPTAPPSGERLTILVASRPFPEPGHARELGGAEGAWTMQSSGITNICAQHTTPCSCSAQTKS